MPQILVGTASWAAASLVASHRFYPPSVQTAAERLRYYATQFPMVEVDASYYAIPAPATAQGWALGTPPGFVFNVKAFRLFTGHPTSLAVLPRDLRAALGARPPGSLFYRQTPVELRDALWASFLEAVAPLRHAGKLGAVHAQFPRWVRADRAGHDFVAHCVGRLAGHTVAVEFRHRSWFEGRQREATLAFERELGAVHVVVDEPQGFEDCVPLVWATTHPALAVVRLHGRNAATWGRTDAAHSGGRFNYAYSQDELSALATPIRELAQAVASTHVVINTNNDDQGPRNARALMRQLSP
jgi:uncharacterized protein YecE (DUF72 family)